MERFIKKSDGKRLHLFLISVIVVVMMGAIAFLLVDLLKALIGKQRNNGKLLIKSIMAISVSALAGFFIALCIHARLRGNGDISEGIKSIIINDVLRRTNGADLNNYYGSIVYIESLTASIWETVCLYFHFPTEVVTGIAGNLFPLVCVRPLGIFAVEIKNKQYIILINIFWIQTIETIEKEKAANT